MALDFPSLAEIPNQNPENTYSPTSTPKASTNGLTYVWNGKSWDLIVATGTGGGGIPEAPNDNFAYSRKNRAWDRNYYLSSEDNDTASGAITFKALTTHEAGVNVKGGDAGTVVDGIFKGNFDGRANLNFALDSETYISLNLDADQVRLAGTVKETATVAYGVAARPKINSSKTDVSALFVRPSIQTGASITNIYGTKVESRTKDAGATVQNNYGFHVGTQGGVGFATLGSNQNIGYYSQVGNITGNDFNFYAEGTAPNYFAGLTEHKGGVKVTGGDAADIGTGFQGIVSDNGEYTIDVVTDGIRTAKFGGYTSQNYYGGITAYGRDMGGLGKNCFNVSGGVGSWSNVGSGGRVTGVYSTMKNVTGIASDVEVSCFNAASSGSASFTNPVSYGFKSTLSKNNNQDTTNQNYNFYASGGAPNYFNGGVQFDTAAGTTALEDYEEGTFAPVFTNPPAGVNYISQRGTYVKIGTIVNIYLEVSYDNASGNDTIEINLPFYTVNLSGAANSGQGYCTVYSATGSSIAGESVSVGMARNNNKLSLVKGVIRTQNAQNSQITFDDIPTAQLRITACYNTRP